MLSDIERLYSVNAMNMKRSVIRDLLKLTAKPDIISFAGGLPASETFPVDDLKPIVAEVLEKEGTRALQYGTTEGDDMLREEIIKFMAADGVTGLTKENILIVSASQQALDMVCKLFVNPNDPVIIGLPSYVGTISAMRSYSARTVGIPVLDDGMDMDKLESEIQRLIKECGPPKFIYVIPDFQNPAGITLTLEKRKRLLEIAYKYQVLIIEDSPY
ncbi:MAG TPA: PLP-dependent aminotransferase family protein, partial [Firmicutes bacterium]|nr:PLP-dependent aminotransferase family protein [Bacillota bacterium]